MKKGRWRELALMTFLGWDVSDLYLVVGAWLRRKVEEWNGAQGEVACNSGYACVAEEEEPMAAEGKEVDARICWQAQVSRSGAREDHCARVGEESWHARREAKAARGDIPTLDVL